MDIQTYPTPDRERTFRDVLENSKTIAKAEITKLEAAITCIDANPGLLELLEFRERYQHGGRVTQSCSF